MTRTPGKPQSSLWGVNVDKKKNYASWGILRILKFWQIIAIFKVKLFFLQNIFGVYNKILVYHPKQMWFILLIKQKAIVAF